MTSVSALRKTFLDFFAERGHIIAPSAPVVPQNDPSLLFVNAGMVPFKDVFTGRSAPAAPRMASVQKCIRAGGKHNDLENVGYTARHHTFFEMLGNFSFGDYFKEEAIVYAWDLVCTTLALPRDRLWVTVYADDTEARALWSKIAGLPEDRIIGIASSDNFWSMGDTGPCGPCSEIFYDHGPGVAGGPPGSPDADGDRFTEIWNLVFMQSNQQASGERTPLPRPCIDTGMGLERMAAVLQGVTNNYSTDLFQTLLSALGDITGTQPDQPSHRVIADHVRSSAIMMADGVLPANEGRGYVLRRIMRRAIRHCHTLGVRDLVLNRMVDPLLETMGEAWPELVRARPVLMMQMTLEEERFRATLERGLSVLEEATARLSPGGCLPGAVAFQLYDTWGFPVDLTASLLAEQGMTLDTAGFDHAMNRQKEEARRSRTERTSADSDPIWKDLAGTLPPVVFTGYQDMEGPALIQALVCDGALQDTVEGPAEVDVVTSQTPFYATSGGQVGDTGTLDTGVARGFQVQGTIRREGLVVHRVHIPAGASLRTGQEGRWQVDSARRAEIRRHHSATHLLHSALRDVLGPHVTQKGSLVEPQRLRFDFSHHHPLTPEEKIRVEDRVNQAILDNVPVQVDVMTCQQAMQKGALALFGEKYAENVRVVSMGQEGPECWSMELCGGTHVAWTGDIGPFVLQSESGVASGVRRIEAVAGKAALEQCRQNRLWLEEAASLLRCPPARITERLRDISQRKTKDKPDLKTPSALPVHEQVWTWGDTTVCLRTTEDPDMDVLRAAVDAWRSQNPDGLIMALSAPPSGRVTIVAGAGAHLALRRSAAEAVKVVSQILGGKGGGGRPDFAQGGGQSLQNLGDVPTALQAWATA